jgi:hypothetical protein
VVFDDDDVMAALVAAVEPVPVGQLTLALRARWPSSDAWRTQLLVAWLLKHGLIG